MVIRSFRRRRSSWFRRILPVIISFTFILNFVAPPTAVFAQGRVSAPLNLPAPGSMVAMSESFTPLYIKGITLDPNDPLKFSFIVNSGDTNLAGDELKTESQKLIKYFLASLTVPEEELWVNLSPYERANIIPERFGYTEMGRDLLSQDYMLKQITASVMYPEGKTGGTFWARIQEKIKEKFGEEDIPVNMFNKIWIVPDKAEVYEINGSAYVVDSHLKVLLEEDYFALKNDVSNSSAVGQSQAQAVSAVSADVVREVLLPEIEKEVNEGKNFANLRQIYNASILATWYKLNLKDSLLGQVYVDKNKVSGVDTQDKSDKLKIYEQYVDAFKKGAYELVKKDYDPATQQIITRKYFSGGVVMDIKGVISSPVKNVSLQEYNKIPLSSPVRQKFAQNVESANPDKNFTVEFTLGAVTQPSSAMAVFSSPMNRNPSPVLASVVSVLSDNSRPAWAAMEENIRGPLQEILSSSRNSTQIKETANRIVQLANMSPGAFFSSGDLERELINFGETPEVAREIVKQGNLGKIITAATNRVDTGIAPLVVASRMDSGNTQKSVQGVLENSPQTREIAPQLSKAIVTTLNQDAGAGQDRTTFMTAVKASPELKGIEPAVIETALQNIDFRDMTSSATSRVDTGIAPLVVASRMDSGNTQKSVQGVLENSPQTREIAPQLSKAIVTTLNQDAGAGQNRTTFMTAVKESPELKGIEPAVIETALQNIDFRDMTSSATNRVDTSIAPVVIAIKTDRQATQENIRAVLESSPDKSISESAGQIASVMAHVVDNSPSATTNKDKFTAGVQNEMRYRGMSEDVIKTAITPWNMNNMINAAIASVEVKTASLPTRINMDQENSRVGIVGAIGKMPDLDLPQNDVSQIAQVMQKIAKTSPDSFINLSAMRQALVREGVSVENANKLTQPQNIRAISEAVSGKVDYSTAVMPALIGAGKEGSRISMAEQLGQVPGISRDEAGKLSNALVEIATTSPGSFSSRDQLKGALGSKGISSNVATIATQDIGLRWITLAVRQPSNSISALEQNPGGIDINPAFLKLLVKRDGKGIPIPTAKVPVKDTDIYGFEPVISNVEKVDDLPAFIGIER